MRARSIAIVLATLVEAYAPEVAAATARYAIVIGNNLGSDPELGALPDLVHAESEARALREKLVTHCNFDPAEDRTMLLLRPTREALVRSVEIIREKMKKDAETFGKTRTLFAFFFTGHGLGGRILLTDGVITREGLRDLFRDVGADLTIGVFDACYSGSLDPDSLLAKGFHSTPGSNVFRELPEEVLGAEGSIWFASSGAEEASYEDRALGGVFTHFLTEALERAEADGPGISLDRIWEYAQTKTSRYTAERGRAQHPQKLVTRMRERSALYFSFPHPRDATLVFGKSVHGTFMLSYRDGYLAEKIVKSPEDAREFAVYPGAARLVRLEGGAPSAWQELDLRSGTKLVVSAEVDRAPEAGIGARVETLWTKGFGGQVLRADRINLDGSLFIGPSYRFSQLSSGALVPEHDFGAEVRWDRGAVVVDLELGYGLRDESFSAWGYSARGGRVSLRGGLALDLAFGRAFILGGLGTGHLWQTYRDGAVRRGWFFSPDIVAGLAVPISETFLVRGALELGASWSSGAGARAEGNWGARFGASTALLVRVF